MDLILGILALPIWCMWQVGRGILWLIVNLGHVLLIPIAFFTAVGLGSSLIAAPMVDGYEDGLEEKYSHEVTVYWNKDRTDFDTFTVREDVNWTFNKNEVENGACSEYYSIFSSSNDCPEKPTLPSEAYSSNGKFLGLFTSPYGVEQYVDSNGYSLKSVKSDIVLYAVFENAE